MLHDLDEMAAVECQLAQPAFGRRQRGNAQHLAEFGEHPHEEGI
ncbi:hypothetical protein [Achromobacter denitrificans]|nr:hypothetical protein [Achromobacter denitrificans]